MMVSDVRLAVMDQAIARDAAGLSDLLVTLKYPETTYWQIRSQCGRLRERGIRLRGGSE
jgi:hypothetical protein